MENAVRFEQPARLRIHEIRQRPARQRRRALLKKVGANRLRRRRLMRIEQGVLHADRDLGLQRGEAQRDVNVGGQC